jgi:predicted nucleic acid-binding protein
VTAVIDSNVLVSALLFGGLPEKVVQAALGNEFLWVTSGPLQREFERVLRDKFRWPEERIQRACQTLWNVARLPSPGLQ